ncbi:MAG: hypothetical protein VXZ64_03460 [Candidatus Thermoplasmatota archaeon]|nr:hypothetical protein [Candidatus Thermoplasmatota archaeon]
MPSVIVTKRDLWPPNMVKSMQLLDAVLREQDRATVMDPRGGIVPTCPRLIAVVLLKGDSGRHYRLSIRDMDDTGLHCSFTVEGARWRTDLMTPYKTGAAVASLCLQSTQHDLPAGDRAVTLVLSLLRDRQTAMRIPLLGQFIAADRALLKDIGMFTDEGPMPDFDEPDEFDFPPMDIEAEELEFPPDEEEPEDPHEWTMLDELYHAPRAQPPAEAPTQAPEQEAPPTQEQILLRAADEAAEVGLEHIAEALRALA